MHLGAHVWGNMLSDVHFEVFAKRPGGAMKLELTHAQEGHAMRVAEEMLASGEFVGVRVVREARDAASGEFKSTVLLKKGEQESSKARVSSAEMGPICSEPADFYTAAARTQMARLMEGWLTHAKVTAFEVLHRPDLVDKLEGAGGEMQHAIQKVAVTQSLGRGVGVHQVVRDLQALTSQAKAQLRTAREEGMAAEVAPKTFAAVCCELAGDPQGAFRLACGVADFIAAGKGWTEKLELLLDLADTAPEDGAARDLAFQVLAQPLSEWLASKVVLGDLLGGESDLGGQIAALLRLAAGEAAEAVAEADPAIAALIPPLNATAQRLSAWLEAAPFADLKRAMVKRLLQEFNTPRRLRPSDAMAEVGLARALGLALTAAAGRELPAEEVREAIFERSRLMVGQDFMDAYLRAERPAMQELFDLARLLDNIVGGANRAQAMRWLQASLTSARFDSELASGPESPAARLAQLARLYRLLARARHDAAGIETALERIAEIADRIEAEKGVVRQVTRANAAVSQKLGMLLRMASGDTAPPGQAAARAKIEAKRLLARPDAMADLARDPEALKQLSTLMKAL